MGLRDLRGIGALFFGRHADPPTLADPAISGTFLTQNGQKKQSFGGKKWPKNGPKMVQKWSKNEQKSDGGAQKIPPKSQKNRKNGQTRPPQSPA